MADWSLLPKDLLELIVGRLETSFEIVQFRSVCSPWRSVVPPLDDNSRCLAIQRFKTSIPFTTTLHLQKKEYCTLKKIPFFLVRFQTPFGADYILAEMYQTKSTKPISVTLPLHHVISPGRRQMLFNSLNSQITPLGHQYLISSYQAMSYCLHSGVKWEKVSERAEFLELISEGCKHFMVLALNPINLMSEHQRNLVMFRSCNMSWSYIIDHPKSYGVYGDMVAFKGNFYVVDSSGWGHVFVIEPSLEVTEIPPVTASHKSSKESLVRSGHDLLMVQRFTPGRSHVDHMYTLFKVFKLNGEGSRRNWVQINELKDQVIFLGACRNLCLSVHMLPGVKENCIVYIKPKTGVFGDIINGKESILVFDLNTRRTSMASTQRNEFMGAFGLNLESLVSCGTVTMPDLATSIYEGV